MKNVDLSVSCRHAVLLPKCASDLKTGNGSGHLISRKRHTTVCSVSEQVTEGLMSNSA